MPNERALSKKVIVAKPSPLLPLLWAKRNIVGCSIPENFSVDGDRATSCTGSSQ